jgi:predicted ATPase/DNA-binding CsgD family transcriptional regulator
MGILAEHLVGRAEEIGRFDNVLDQLDRGRSAAIVLGGEPGIGKTRLLAELSARADARGHLVLSGSASELERDLPFWVFVDALDEYVHGLEPNRLEALDGDVRTELAAVLPSQSALATEGASGLRHERYRSHHAVSELLELLAGSRPLVLALDDVHWADPGSVELLGALLRRPPVAPVLMALALRPGQVPARLSSALAHAHRAGTLDRTDLEALTRAEARELLGDASARLEADDLYEESGGNPFYLEQLARSMSRAVQVSPAAAVSLAGVDVPPLVAAALSEELALLSDTARLVLAGAAVAGDPFETELAAAAAAMSEDAAIQALDELSRLGLVRGTDVPRRYRFRHPLLRRAVYESTPSGWRLGAHERSARTLAARGAPAVARAHHVELSARPGDAAAVAILREAGEATAQRAPAIAARWFAGALRLVSEGAPTDERVELLLAQARALAASGQFAEGRAALLESIALVPDDSVALRVQLTTACAGVEHLLGHHEQAHRRLTGALDGLADPTSQDAVALMVELSVDGFYRMEFEPMREWAARALRAARPLGNQPLTAAALAAVAYAGALTGAIAEAEAHRSEAAALVAALPDQQLALRLDAVVNLAAAEIDLERLAEAGAHAERALAIGRATGQSDVVPVLMYCLGWVRRLRGELAEGAELLDRAVESARVSGNAVSLAGNLLNRSLTALAAGDVELALATAEESVDLTRHLDQSLTSASAGLALAAALAETGNPAGAVDVLVGPGGGDDLPLIPGAWRAHWLELLTRCRLALGRFDEARRSAAAAEACAAARGLRLATGMADRAAAAVMLENGEPDRAAERGLASAAAADEVGAPVEAALSRRLAGRALARAGHRERAVAELQQAAAQFDTCGAVRYRNQAEHELRKLGQHVHRRTRPGQKDGAGLTSLTERELQVAQLVVDRKTNPEIAAELFLSPKTVETHLRHMFHKLGVASRIELARAVEHAGRTTSAVPH